MEEILTDDQIRGLKSRLDHRYEQLRHEIHAGLAQAGEARLAEEVRDLEDEAFASVLEDLRIADIARDVEEARDIERARDRIAVGSYGYCSDCGQPVAIERLRAYPAAKRCRYCQERYEREHGARRSSTL